MTTRKLLRRRLFTAAVTTALALSAVTSNAVTFEIAVNSPANGIQRVLYQPGQEGQPGGQSTGQPASNVSAELKKIFEANGQPMPSMNERDLPNAHVHQPAMNPQNKPAFPQQAAPQQQMQGMGQPGMQKPGMPQSGMQQGMKPQGMSQQGMQQAGMQQQGMAKAPQAGRGQTPSPPRKNFLQKFIGKVNGAEKKAAEAAVVPPVPPGYQEPPPAPPSGGSMTAQMPSGQMNGQMNGQNGQNKMQGQQAMQQPQNRPANPQYAGGQPGSNASLQSNAVRSVSNSKVLPKTTPAPQGSVTQSGPRQANAQPQVEGNRSQPGSASGSSSQTRMTQASSPKTATVSQGQSQTMRQPGRPAPATNVPAVPRASGDSVANPSSGYPTRQAPQYVQPGTAPAFMPVGQSPPAMVPQNSSATAAAVAASPAVAPVVPKPADDGFEDPFTESAFGDETSDVLDLDAIANTPTINEPVLSQQGAASATVAAPETIAIPKAAAVVTPFTESAPQSKSLPTFTEDGAVPLDPVEEERNPFTGVQLDEPEEMFDPSLSGNPAAQSSKLEVNPLEPPETGGAFGDPVPAMEDFGDDIPAIGLPTVDEFDQQPVEPAPQVMAIPDLDGKESLSPSGSASTPTPVSSSTTNPGGTAGRQSGASAVDVTESRSATLRGVDSERLQQTAEQDRRARQQRLIQSRSSQTGFKGFCPVELRDRRELLDTKPEFTATFGLQTYSFSSAAAKAAFEADPSRYAPAAGGSDVVLLVNSGEEQPGMLDYALWYRDRLYLFRSRETMALFNSDPLRFANQY